MQQLIKNSNYFELEQAEKCEVCGMTLEIGYIAIVIDGKFYCSSYCQEDPTESHRTHYHNGMELSSKTALCDDCQASVINGHLCHEFECPSLWKDYKIRCNKCGCDFYRTEKHQRTCGDCQRTEEIFWDEDQYEGYYP